MRPLQRLAAVLVAAISVGGCGYRAVHGGGGGGEGGVPRCDVVLGTTNVPDVVVTDEVLAGVRDELARHGALGPGRERCVVEVLRADEASEGIAAVPGPATTPGSTAEPGRLLPTSRATRVGVLARGMRVRGPVASPEAVTRDTGDVRAFETVAAAPDARDATFRHADALRAAARRVGRRLGQRLVGLPSASED